MDGPRTWDFDGYDWIDRYDEYTRGLPRLCYEQAIAALPRLCRAEPQDTVLDIGAGTGNFAVPFLEAGCTVLAIDPSERMLRRAQDKVARYGRRLCVQHVDDAFLRLLLDDRRFHIAFAAYAIHHLDDCAKRQAIRGMRSCLRPEGRIVIVDTMFADEAHKARMLATDDTLEDEYHPLLSTFPAMVAEEGLAVELTQIGPLVWVLAGTRDA